MFRATGATLSNISGKGSRALAFVDDQSRMRIALDSEELFRSAAPSGAASTMLMVKTQVERGGRSYPYKPEPAPLAVDLDGDGIDEIMVPQNQFPGRLAVIFKGPAGYRFQTVNSGFEGTISALGADSVRRRDHAPAGRRGGALHEHVQYRRRDPDHHDVVGVTSARLRPLDPDHALRLLDGPSSPSRLPGPGRRMKAGRVTLATTPPRGMRDVLPRRGGAARRGASSRSSRCTAATASGASRRRRWRACRCSSAARAATTRS